MKADRPKRTVKAGKQAKLDNMSRPLNPFAALLQWRLSRSNTDKVYGAIVAQARLPIFYRSYGVPDTIDGRFVVLSLHLFALLHRLQLEGARAQGPAQALVDRFKDDMETVLREVGIGDLAIPKKVRTLTASSHALLRTYATALAAGKPALAAAIAEVLPLEPRGARAASGPLASYVWGIVGELERQPIERLLAGELHFQEATEAHA
jgi:cytochrome b pre-mRNA-processing protein 3